jgi:hypothetical protein
VCAFGQGACGPRRAGPSRRRRLNFTGRCKGVDRRCWHRRPRYRNRSSPWAFVSPRDSQRSVRLNTRCVRLRIQRWSNKRDTFACRLPRGTQASSDRRLASSSPRRTWLGPSFLARAGSRRQARTARSIGSCTCQPFRCSRRWHRGRPSYTTRAPFAFAPNSKWPPCGHPEPRKPAPPHRRRCQSRDNKPPTCLD